MNAEKNKLNNDDDDDQSEHHNYQYPCFFSLCSRKLSQLPTTIIPSHYETTENCLPRDEKS